MILDLMPANLYPERNIMSYVIGLIGGFYYEKTHKKGQLKMSTLKSATVYRTHRNAINRIRKINLQFPNSFPCLIEYQEQERN